MKPSSQFALPLALLRDELVRADLLPPIYHRYRPLLADGICFFLERLPAARLRRIFLEQSRLAASTSTAQRIIVLLHHLPTLHKLGQVVARNRRLNRDFRAWLQRLESFEPRTSAAAIVRLLDREFSGWRKAGIKLGPEALAEGSVAVGAPFTWKGGADGEPGEGVFKLLKPGIQSRLTEELRIWAALADFIEEDCQRYHLPKLDYRETFDLVRDLLVHESIDSVVIPALLPFCSPRMTAMTRLHGITLTAGLERGDPSAQALAPQVAEALVAAPMFSSRSAALFHGDPHAGNLFITTGGRLGILDWSLAGHLQKSDRVGLVQLLLGALTFDERRMQHALAALSRDTARPAAVADVLSHSLRELRWGTRAGVAWLTRLLDSVVTQARARFPANLLLFRKSLLTLEGVMADLSGEDEAAGDESLDRALFAALSRQLITEWPRRFYSPLNSRAFNTSVSNVDLVSLFSSGPAVFARYWAETWRDLLDRSSA